MAGEQDPFRAAEAQAKQQQHEREQAQQPQGEEQAPQGQQPTAAEFEQYDEAVGENVKGISGASAGGPAV